jgi:hypothetical protein
LLLLACTASHAVAQNAPSRLVFTVGVPDSASSQPALHVSMAVEERGLAMWSGSVSDFGVAVEIMQSKWTLRGLTGTTTLPIDQVPPAQFNRVLWKGLMGNKPYPALRGVVTTDDDEREKRKK